MHTLKIEDEHGINVVMLRIPPVDPAAATIAILNALKDIPTPRKPRADKGVPRTTTPELEIH